MSIRLGDGEGNVLDHVVDGLSIDVRPLGEDGLQFAAQECCVGRIASPSHHLLRCALD